VDRFVQMSALGVDSAVETAYFDAKREAERTVRASSLSWVIYRPSIVFGDGCRFLPFLRRLSAAGIVPLPGGGRMRVHPLWVDDLAGMLAEGVTDPRRSSETYRLGGPTKQTLAELVTLLRPQTIVVPIPNLVALPLAGIAEAVPACRSVVIRYGSNSTITSPNRTMWRTLVSTRRSCAPWKRISRASEPDRTLSSGDSAGQSGAYRETKGFS
jgi:hypothetical protein